jgi:hypothetical protein
MPMTRSMTATTTWYNYFRNKRAMRRCDAAVWLYGLSYLLFPSSTPVCPLTP